MLAAFLGHGTYRPPTGQSILRSLARPPSPFTPTQVGCLPRAWCGHGRDQRIPEQASAGAGGFSEIFPGSPLPPQTMKSACPIINSHHDRDVTKDSGQWEPEISSGQSLASAQNPRVGRGEDRWLPAVGLLPPCTNELHLWPGPSEPLPLCVTEHPAFLCL